MADNPLATSVGGLRLEIPVMNAAGTAKTLEDVRRLAAAPIGAIVVGSITMEPREGNPGTVYAWEGEYSLNSLGLPNGGWSYYQGVLAEMGRTAHAAGKKLIVSIAAMGIQETKELARRCADSGADAIELNAACPNVWNDGTQKSLLCFDSDELLYYLWDMVGPGGTTIPYFVKVAPYSDPGALGRVAETLTEAPGNVTAVVCCNTFPNALDFRTDGEPRTATPLAGLGGRSMKPIALGQVYQFRRLLHDGSEGRAIDVIGCGGIVTARDVRDYQRAGAAGVQVATAYLERGPKVFREIAMGIAESVVP